MRSIGYGLLLLGIVTAGLQLAYFGPRLPVHVASNFGHGGQPNGWMSRSAFLYLFAAVQVGLPILLLGMGKLMYVLPANLINLPNKAYWFQEGRREEALRFHEGVLIWVAGMTALFLSGVLWLVFDANLHGRGLHEPVFLSMLLVYLVAVFASVIVLHRHFGRIVK